MRRPVSTVVFGILNLAFAMSGLMGLFMSAAMLFSRDAARGNPVVELARKNPGYALFMEISVPLGIAAMFVLLLGGVGLLLLKPWGRHLSILFGLYGIVASIAGVVVNWYFLMPLLAKAAELPAGPLRAGWIAGVIGGVAGAGLGIIYPIALLCFMFRPTIEAACQSPCCAETVE